MIIKWREKELMNGVATFPDTVSGLAIVKLLDCDILNTMMLKFMLERNSSA